MQLIENFTNWRLDPDYEHPGKPIQSNPGTDPKNTMCGNSICFGAQDSEKQLEKIRRGPF
jgi:hypothetical protein